MDEKPEPQEQNNLALHPLPQRAIELINALPVSPHLLAHLVLVHDVASRLVEGVQATWPELEFDAERVLFGAATHDIGKVRHPEEMVGPGQAHHGAGVDLLQEQGVEPEWARFARTHATWQEEEPVMLEDLLVALADVVWAGGRNRTLEDAITAQIAQASDGEAWQVYMQLDDLIVKAGADAELRLVWQTQFASPEDLE
jgi:putative nucleotidyltransferase with HDIG domain